jgi:hypothetical protein
MTIIVTGVAKSMYVEWNTRLSPMALFIQLYSWFETDITEPSSSKCTHLFPVAASPLSNSSHSHMRVPDNPGKWTRGNQIVGENLLRNMLFS